MSARAALAPEQARTPSAGRYLPALDALRGGAAFAVVVVHAVGVYARGAGDDAVRPWVARLDVAVPIFLLLSGFLLYKPWVEARRTGERLSVAGYARRRVLRIVPGYWVALLVAVLVLSLPGVLSARGIVRYFGFAQAYDADTVGGGIPVGWTLCVEAVFYAFLPLWALLLRRLPGGLRSEALGLAALALASIAWKAVVLAAVVPAHVSATDPWLIAFPAYLDFFVLGMALAVASVAWDERGGAPPGIARWATASWVAALAVFVLSAYGAGLDDVDPRGFTHGEFVVRHALHGVIALALMFGAVVGGGLPERILRPRWLRHVGTISYGLYLYHLTVLGVLGLWGFAAWEDTVPRHLLWLTGAMLGGLVLAELSWRLIERPALRFSPSWRPRRRRRPAPRG